MTALALILITLSAILHSGWNMILKRNNASFASYAIMYFPDLIIWAHLQFWTPVHVWQLPWQFFMMVFLSVCCDVTYGQCLVAAYRRMDMSLAYPMMRSLPIMFTLCLTHALGLGEPIFWPAVLGMCLVFVGCLVMPLKSFGDFSLRNYFNRNILLIILVALGTTGYTLFDSLGQDIMRAHSQEISPLMVTLTYYSTRCLGLNSLGWLVGLSVPAYRKDFPDTFRNHLVAVVLAGICSSLTYVLVLLAMNFVENVTFVQVFRQLALPIGMVLAIVFLHERATLPKVIGVTLILGGLALCLVKKPASVEEDNIQLPMTEETQVLQNSGGEQ